LRLMSWTLVGRPISELSSHITRYHKTSQIATEKAQKCSSSSQRPKSCAPVGNRRSPAGCQPAAGYQPAPQFHPGSCLHSFPPTPRKAAPFPKTWSFARSSWFRPSPRKTTWPTASCCSNRPRRLATRMATPGIIARCSNANSGRAIRPTRWRKDRKISRHATELALHSQRRRGHGRPFERPGLRPLRPRPRTPDRRLTGHHREPARRAQLAGAHGRRRRPGRDLHRHPRHRTRTGCSRRQLCRYLRQRRGVARWPIFHRQPMVEISNDVRTRVRALKVAVFLDTCHSAGAIAQTVTLPSSISPQITPG